MDNIKRKGNSISPKERSILRKMMLSKYENSEYKNFDSEVYDLSLTQNSLNANVEPGTTKALNTIARGDGPNNRIGREYLLDHISVRGQVRYLPSATDSPQPTVRLILYVDKRTNSSGNGNGTVMYDAPTNPENTIFAYQSLGNTDRFDILHDNYHVLTPTANVGATEQADATWHFILKKSLTNRMYECQGLSNYTLPTNYSIRLLALCNNPDLYLDYCYRIRFRG